MSMERLTTSVSAHHWQALQGLTWVSLVDGQEDA